MSNQATIPCPKCGHALNNLLRIIFEEGTRHPIGHHLHCNRCEHVWTDWKKSER